MKKVYQVLGIMALVFIINPHLCSAAAKAKTVTGIVTKIYNNQITIKTTSGASYVAETSQAALIRKNGSAMKLEEILLSDKVEISGTFWSDNSINSSQIRNLSLYAHSGTYIRSIARHLGQALNSDSLLYGLKRTAIGKFSL